MQMKGLLVGSKRERLLPATSAFVKYQRHLCSSYYPIYTPCTSVPMFHVFLCPTGSQRGFSFFAINIYSALFKRCSTRRTDGGWWWCGHGHRGVIYENMSIEQQQPGGATHARTVVVVWPYHLHCIVLLLTRTWDRVYATVCAQCGKGGGRCASDTFLSRTFDQER
ncbi:hypothetical protein BC832DRAFT_299223 [Gaertneriomyces semiglobifer]|nr:hypothetical protein BC832DRAFT_299223 [Gaertneriomyces semiglobifer]